MSFAEKICFIFILLLSISLIGCGTSTATNQTIAIKNITLNVTMDLTSQTSASGTEMYITTNLPNGTELTVSLSNSKLNYQAGDDSITVQDGKAVTEAFSSDSLPLQPGTYIAKVSASNINQPQAVKTIMGDKGKNLAGTCLTNDPTFGKQVDFTKNVTITVK